MRMSRLVDGRDIMKFFSRLDFSIPCSRIQCLEKFEIFGIFRKSFEEEPVRDKMSRSSHCADSYLSFLFTIELRRSDSIFFPLDVQVGGRARVSRYFIRVHTRVHRSCSLQLRSMIHKSILLFLIESFFKSHTFLLRYFHRKKKKKKYRFVEE